MTYFDLGPHTFPVTTQSADAQRWFDRGLLWTFGFNHAEAIKCFERAAQYDPTCAMAYWGKAYAAGPNYNVPWKRLDEAGAKAMLEASFDAAQEALAKVDHASATERRLIEALQARYPQRTILDDMSVWNDAFATAMRNAHDATPDCLLTRTVLVEALLNRFPWNMWNIATGIPTPGADTLEAQRLCETAFSESAAARAHPGLTHLYVHLMEMSPTPEKALKAADLLRRTCPDAGHLIHMPTHIDVQVGDYQSVVDWNRAAVAADLKFYDLHGPFNMYTGYRAHNYHFVIYGAMFLGQFDVAMQAVDGMAETVTEDFLRTESPPMADFYESYLSFRPHVLVRFGRWREATELTLPEDQDLYCTLTAHVHYARALGHAALGEVAQALEAEQHFLAACDRVPDSRLMHNNAVYTLLEVGKAMLRGEILYRQAEYDAAFAELRRAVALDDGLAYDEPWGWMQPTRHALGALLFEQGHVEEAEFIFRQDLGLEDGLPRALQHPNNVWALKGLHDCLKARGEKVELIHISRALAIAEARSDAPVAAPCGCAQAAILQQG